MANKFYQSPGLTVYRCDNGSVMLKQLDHLDNSVAVVMSETDWIQFLITATGENVSFHRARRHAEPVPA